MRHAHSVNAIAALQSLRDATGHTTAAASNVQFAPFYHEFGPLTHDFTMTCGGDIVCINITCPAA